MQYLEGLRSLSPTFVGPEQMPLNTEGANTSWVNICGSGVKGEHYLSIFKFLRACVVVLHPF